MSREEAKGLFSKQGLEINDWKRNDLNLLKEGRILPKIASRYYDNDMHMSVFTKRTNDQFRSA